MFKDVLVYILFRRGQRSESGSRRSAATSAMGGSIDSARLVSKYVDRVASAGKDGTAVHFYAGAHVCRVGHVPRWRSVGHRTTQEGINHLPDTVRGR